MADHATFEERPWPYAACPVDHLVGNKEVSGFDFFFETAYRAKSYAAAHAKPAECSNVGSVVDFVRSDLVMEAVTGEKGDGDWLRWV